MTATTLAEPHALTLRARLGDPRTVGDILAGTDAITHGHFALLDGDHADSFIRFSRVAERPAALEMTADWLLPSVSAWLPDVVLAPATAGVALGWTLAQRLGLPLVLANVDADGRAHDVNDPEALRDRHVLLVNDVVTTGRGMAALARVATEGGAAVAGGAWFLSRDTVDVSELIGAPVSYIGDLLLPHWPPASCPLCAGNEPVTSAVDIN